MITILTDKKLRGALYVKHLSRFFEVSGYETSFKKLRKRVKYLNPDKILIDTKIPLRLLIPFFISTDKDIILVNHDYPNYYIPIFYRLNVKLTPPHLQSITALLSQPKSTAYYMDISKQLKLPKYFDAISFPPHIHTPQLFAKYLRIKNKLPTPLNKIEEQRIQELVNNNTFPRDTTPFTPDYRP